MTRCPVFVLAALALAACGGKSATAPGSQGVVGSWQLITTDGAPLPEGTTLYNSRTQVNWMASRLTVNADGTVADSETYQNLGPDGSPIGAVYTVGASGTYHVIDNRDATFNVPTYGLIGPAVVNGDLLEVTTIHTLVYTRR